MAKGLTTKDYVVTKDGIDVVEKPSKDILRDEIEEEQKLVKAIVDKWNELVTAAENKTIQFALIVSRLLKDFPTEKKKYIIKKVVKHKDLKTSISKDRIYQGLRLIERRPDLIAFTPGEPNPDLKVEPYLKEDGSIFWEFYFELFKYQLGDDSKVRLEKDGKKNKWSVRDLRQNIYKERDLITGDARNDRKKDLLKVIFAKIKTLDVKKLEIVDDFIDSIKDVKGDYNED